MTQASVQASWWMYHGDPAHTGYVSDSPITSATVARLQTVKDVQLDGPILSTPAIAGGFVYVGTANSHGAVGSNGGAFYKIELATGAKSSFPSVSNFTFSPDGDWLLMRPQVPGAAPAGGGNAPAGRGGRGGAAANAADNNAPAADLSANGQLFEEWPGFPLQGGECLRLTFERRAFFPW